MGDLALILFNGVLLELVKNQSLLVVEARDGISHLLVLPRKAIFEQESLPVNFQVFRGKSDVVRT